MAEEPFDYKYQLAEMLKTKIAEVDQVLAKRPHETDPPAPSKVPCSMFTKLFGSRRQSVTREDFDQTWQRLEQRKEHYKARTEELTAKTKSKDNQIIELERRMKELEQQLGEEQKKTDTLREYIDSFYQKVEQICGDDVDEVDNNVDLPGYVAEE